MYRYPTKSSSASDQRDAGEMYLIEWIRRGTGKSAAATYMDIWKDLDQTRKEFEETGFNGLFLKK